MHQIKDSQWETLQGGTSNLSIQPQTVSESERES